MSLHPFLTNYAKDFTTKSAPLTKPFPAEQEFRDPVAEGFRETVTLGSIRPPPEPPLQTVTDFTDKLRKEKPELVKRYLHEPIDEEMMEEFKKANKLSTYRREFRSQCSQYKDYSQKTSTVLPSKWMVPETTNGSDFRNYADFLPREVMQPPEPIPGINNLDRNKKYDEIMKIKTGNTEYESEIGALGGYIIEENLYGELRDPLEVFREDVRKKKEERKKKFNDSLI